VRPAVFCSLIETVADLVKITTTKDGVSEIKPAICSEAIARLILACETFKLSLPLITFLAPSPVLIDDNGKLVQVTGYHGATAFSRFAAICQKLNCRGQSSLSIPYWLIFGSQRMATLLGLWVTVNESPSLQCVVG
jgi:hypothetical protein